MSQDEIYLYRCTECGKLSVSIGWLHAHVEKHRGYGPFNVLSIPGQFNKLMEMTEVIRVTETETVDLDDVPERLIADGGTVQACPECDTTEIHCRTGRIDPEKAGTWHCPYCGADFDEPERRRARSHGNETLPGGTLAARLAGMEADDLVTDGGTSTGGSELVEIVEDNTRARTHFKRPLSENRPEEPKITVSADLFAELAAYAGRQNWVASNVTMQEAREALRSLHTDRDLRTDGGHTPPNMRIADRGWPDDAVDNKLRWGQQPPIDLTLALIEEVGELADELLQSGRFESAEAKHARVCLSAARDAGFATRSFLESFFEDEDGEPLPIEDRPELGDGIDADAVLEELGDLAPLCYQLAWALDKPDELVTDGGHLPSDPGPEAYLDPEDDPFACSICGAPLGESKRIRGEEHCDMCQREYGPVEYLEDRR